MQDDTTFGALLRQFRRAAGLTQEALAEQTQLSAIAISALERGTRQAPYAETVRRLATALALAPEQQQALRSAARRPRAAATQDTRGAAPHSQIPTPLTSFVGRERELAALTHLLVDGRRLVTVIGPGGVGKTRLALEVVPATAPAFPDGIWVCDLAPLTDPALVAQSIATLLGVRLTPSRSAVDGIVATLGDRATLLVLDNCEHLSDACAGLVQALLRACGGLSVLATSREPLHLAGERRYPIAPLPVPEPDGAPARRSAPLIPAAVRLFLDRAQAVRPDFTPTPAALVLVGSICRALDGLPLAIEMVAAQTHVLSLDQLLARVRGHLETLVAHDRGVTPRHATLHALLAWSYTRLSDAEQVILQRLAVFAGGGDLDAVEAVCADAAIPRSAVVGLLTALVEKSLLLADVQPAVARYRLLETVRSFAVEQLGASGEAATIQVRHAAYFLQLARRGRRALTGPEQAAWVQRLEREHHNLHNALATSLAAGDGDTALRLCAALAMFWYIRGYYSEGRDWIRDSLRVGAGAAPRLRAAALHGAASLADIQHDHDEALRQMQESVTLWRTVEDVRGLAAALAELGMLARHSGDLAAARRACDEALALYRAAPDPWGERLARGVLGWVAEAEGDRAAAWRWLEESLAAAQAAQSPVDIALQLNNLGILALRSGWIDEAETRYSEALRLGQEVDALEPVACSLEGFAAVAARRGDAWRAAWLAGAAAAVRDTIGAPRVAQFEEEYQRLSSALRAALREQDLAEAAAAGAATPLGDVLTAVRTGTGTEATPGSEPLPLRRA